MRKRKRCLATVCALHQHASGANLCDRHKTRKSILRVQKAARTGGVAKGRERATSNQPVPVVPRQLRLPADRAGCVEVGMKVEVRGVWRWG